MHDLVRARKCGLAMWQIPAADIAVELHKKMHDQEWLSQAGRAARQLAEECFDRDKLAQQLIQVLEVAREGAPEKVAQIAPGAYEV